MIFFMRKPIKITLYTTAILVVILAVAYTILKVIAFQKAINNIEQHIAKELKKRKKTVEWVSEPDSTLKNLLVDKAYYNALITASKTDSIFLAINIPDSTVSLMIKGVVAHKAKAEHIKVSPLFSAINPPLLIQGLSVPLTISKHTSTIPKVPLMIKIAPRDTSEYTPDVIPDTTDLDPVNFIIELKPNILLYFYESNPSQSSDGFNQFKFDLRERTWTVVQDVKRMLKLKTPVYKPYIRFRLGKKDAKVIYRAIPNQGQVVLRLE